MTDYPETLIGLVSEAVKRHQDVDPAVSEVEQAWNECEESAEWVAEMVRGQIRSLVHDQRHRMNVAYRKAAGDYGQPAKVGVTAANDVAMKSLLDGYTICGRRLGDILGNELPAFAESEAERANGHTFNATLCRRLSELVSGEQAVRQVLTEAKAWKLFCELRGTKAKKQTRRRETAVA